MPPNDRNYNADYYDVITTQTEDIEFYLRFLEDHSRVLELGCGTGRVTGALMERAAHVVGVDLSEAMLERARAKHSRPEATFLQGDITAVQLERQFDLIIAPFRVIQALEHDAQVSGLFQVIRSHLADGGLAILNVFNPFLPSDQMAAGWPREQLTFVEEHELPNGDTLRVFDERMRIDSERQVLFPKLIHRRFRGERLIDEHVNPICMRYYYPDQFCDLIESHGFTVVDRWGGYRDEPYGEGGELVVAFR